VANELEIKADEAMRRASLVAGRDAVKRSSGTVTPYFTASQA